jgi:bacterial/archaeal transporter family protein
VFAALFGVIFLGEQLTAPNRLSIGLVTIGALLVAYR